MLHRWNDRLERMAGAWGRMSPRRRAVWAYAILALGVAVLFGALFAVLPLTGNGLIFRGDDYQQHYPFLISIGRWLRTLIADPSNAAFFDFTQGFGADWIAGLNYYGVGDPLTLLAVFFDGASTEVGYALLVVIRHVLAAWAFLALCRYFGIRYSAAMPAAAAYAFTNYMLAWCALTHPMFANPAIHLPLILLGAEKRLRGESPAVLILSVAWSALCGFYFLYMNSLMLLVYALVRNAMLNRGCAVKALPGSFVRAIVPYVLGLMLAAAYLVPAVLGYLSCGRGDLSYDQNLLVYGQDVYWAFPISFVSSNGWNNAMTVPVAAMFALCALWRGRKAHRALAVSAACMAIALLIPAIGWVFNGFSYVSDRFKYAGLLLYCFIFAKFMPEVERGGIGRAYCCVLIGWCAVLLARWKLAGAAVPHVMLIALCAALCIGGLVYLALARGLQRKLAAVPHLRRAASAGLLAAFVAANLFANALVLCVDLIASHPGMDSAWTRRSETSLWAAPEAEDEFFRTDLTCAEYFQYNAPAVAGVASTSVYNSIRPDVTAQFMQDLQLNTDVSANRVHGLDSRAALEAIWSVKVLTMPSGATAAVPYGFEPVSDDGRYALYENTLALPAAYAMDAAMDAGRYAALSPLEKQWALLQCAVVEDVEGRFAAAEPVFSDVELEWAVGEMENATFDGRALRFGAGGGWVELTFAAPEDCELYLALEGVVCPDPDAPLQIYVTLESAGVNGMLLIPTDGYDYSLHRRDFLNHLGYSAEARGSLILHGSSAISLEMDAVRVLAQPMADFEALIAARREGVEEVSMPEADVLRARVDFEGDRMLVFGVPYLAGWSAKIDGADAKLESSAGALCMVQVPAGVHEVVLEYRTPGLLAGLVLGAAGALATVGWLVVRRRRG